MNKSYESIKLFLFKNVIKNDLEETVLKIKETLNISIKDINTVLNDMEVDREVVIKEGYIYMVDEIHYKVGTLRVIRGQFAFVGEGESAVYVSSADFGDAIDQDEVLVKVLHQDRISGKVEHVLSRKKEYVLGTINEKGWFLPFDRKIPNRVKFDSKYETVLPNQRIIGKIEKVEAGILYLSMHSVLGMVDEPGIDILSILFEHDLETDFDEAVLEEAKLIPEVVDSKDFEGRIDHRNQMAFTIDGEDAKDLDDAVYLERLNNGYRLYVHIADVSHYVKEGTAIDHTAYARTSSIYMVDRVIPMLPTSISNGICSLHPNVDRLALTCKMDIDNEGEIYNYEVYPSIINSKRRMSYNEINNGDDFGEFTEVIQMMLDCAAILQEKGTKKGSIDFDSDESQFLVDHTGKVLDIFGRSQGEAEKMIESFMVSANESVAKFCKHLELPVLYRVHEIPDRDKMQDLSHVLRILGYKLKGDLSNMHPKALQNVLDYFENKPESLVVSRLTLRSMKKARYTHQPLGHFGLALSDYAHFTAPIRRYSDLHLHRTIRNYVFKGDYSQYNDAIIFTQEAGEHISKKERSILEAEREVEKLKKAEFMKDKIGESYEGIISGVSNYGIFVELPNTVEGVVQLRSLNDDFYSLDSITQKLVGERSGNEYKLGQKIQVQVVEIEKLESDVILKIKNRGRKRDKKYRKK